MDHIFGSKWLIKKLSRLDFSISYDEVNRYKQSEIENNNIIDMQKDLPEDAFVQYSADNVDHNTCTIDGKGTFHGMGLSMDFFPVKSGRVSSEEGVCSISYKLFLI